MRNVFALLIAEIAAAILMHIPVFSVGFVYEPLQDGGWVLVGRNGTINVTIRDSYFIPILNHLIFYIPYHYKDDIH